MDHDFQFVKCPSTDKYIDASIFLKLISKSSPQEIDREIDKALNFFLRNLDVKNMSEPDRLEFTHHIKTIQSMRDLFLKTNILNNEG